MVTAVGVVFVRHRGPREKQRTPCHCPSDRESAPTPLPTRLQQANNAGMTTQVPTGRMVAVRGRVRRQIGYDGVYLKFERAGPTPR